MTIAVLQRDIQQAAVELLARLHVQVGGTGGQLRARPVGQRLRPVGGRAGGVRDIGIGKRQRQVGRADGVARCQGRQPPAHVLQLAHVARPRLCLQALQRRRGQLLHRRSQPACGVGEEVRGQLRDVLAALAQRRQPQPHHVEAVQQVGTEAALFHQRLQRLVGGGDHPHVDADQLAPADAEEFAFGQHPQQPGLQRRGHVADLVEEQGAAVGLFEAPELALGRAGEGTGLVAEQFGFQQLGGDRGGVQRHERARRARRFAVQRARHQLLAGAGFAGDQHRQRHLRQPADGAEQFAHRRGLADQRRQRFGGRGSGCGNGHCVARRQGPVHQSHGGIEVEGFGQEFLRAATERPGGAGHVGMRRHHDHRQARQRLLQPVQQHQAAVAGHAHVGQQQVGRAAGRQRGQHFAGIGKGGDAEAGLAQCGGQHEAHRAVVIHHPDLCRISHGVAPVPPPAAAAG